MATTRLGIQLCNRACDELCSDTTPAHAHMMSSPLAYAHDGMSCSLSSVSLRSCQDNTMATLAPTR